MTVTVHCDPCAGTGQWPNHDGSVIDRCPFCDASGGWDVEIPFALEWQLRELVGEQRREREGGAA